MRYGYGGSSPWSALGQGLANGYLLRLQQQMQQQAMMQKLAQERQASQEDRQASLENEVLKQGGHEALQALLSGNFGGLKSMAEAEAERKNQAAAVMEIAKNAGPDAAFRFARGMATNTPGFSPPTPAPDETEIGEIGSRYRVPIPGQTAGVAPFEGLETIKQKGRRDNAVFTHGLTTTAQVEKEQREQTRKAKEQADFAAFVKSNPSLSAIFGDQVEALGDVPHGGQTAILSAAGAQHRGEQDRIQRAEESAGRRAMGETERAAKLAQEDADRRAGGEAVGAVMGGKRPADLSKVPTRLMGPLLIAMTRKQGGGRGGKLTDADKTVQALAEMYQTSPDYKDIPEYKGKAPDWGITYGARPAKSRRDLAWAHVSKATSDQERNRRLRAFQSVFPDNPADHVPATDEDEEDESGPIEVPTRPSPAKLPSRSVPSKNRLSGQKTTKPDGTYKLPSGETVTVRGGVIQ